MKNATGERAIAGALSRISKNSNHQDELRDPSSCSEFGDWDDWDNGHSDGPSD